MYLTVWRFQLQCAQCWGGKMHGILHCNAEAPPKLDAKFEDHALYQIKSSVLKAFQILPPSHLCWYCCSHEFLMVACITVLVISIIIAVVVVVAVATVCSCPCCLPCRRWNPWSMRLLNVSLSILLLIRCYCKQSFLCKYHIESCFKFKVMYKPIELLMRLPCLPTGNGSCEEKEGFKAGKTISETIGKVYGPLH